MFTKPGGLIGSAFGVEVMRCCRGQTVPCGDAAPRRAWWLQRAWWLLSKGEGADPGPRNGRYANRDTPLMFPIVPPPPQIAVHKWTDQDFRDADEGQMPLGKATDEWAFGNVDEAVKKAAAVHTDILHPSRASCRHCGGRHVGGPPAMSSGVE